VNLVFVINNDSHGLNMDTTPTDIYWQTIWFTLKNPKNKPICTNPPPTHPTILEILGLDQHHSRRAAGKLHRAFTWRAVILIFQDSDKKEAECVPQLAAENTCQDTYK
jgi:hypothetical protein